MAVDWKAYAHRLKSRQENAEERTNDMLMLGADTLGVMVGLGIPAYLHGRKGGVPEVGKIPMDALLGGVLGLAGWGLTWSGYSAYGRFANSLGTGFGGYWFATMMNRYGQRQREKAGQLKSTYPNSLRQLTDVEAKEAGVQVREVPVAGGELEDGAMRVAAHHRQHRQQAQGAFSLY